MYIYNVYIYIYSILHIICIDLYTVSHAVSFCIPSISFSYDPCTPMRFWRPMVVLLEVLSHMPAAMGKHHLTELGYLVMFIQYLYPISSYHIILFRNVTHHGFQVESAQFQESIFPSWSTFFRSVSCVIAHWPNCVCTTKWVEVGFPIRKHHKWFGAKQSHLGRYHTRSWTPMHPTRFLPGSHTGALSTALSKATRTVKRAGACSVRAALLFSHQLETSWN